TRAGRAAPVGAGPTGAPRGRREGRGRGPRTARPGGGGRGARAPARGLSGRASFVAGDYGRALRGPVDILVSNPPYVARADIAGLQAEVRDFDPRRALDGGPDGLDGYRAIASHAARLLAPDGILVLELGHGQLGPVTSIFTPAV